MSSWKVGDKLVIASTDFDMNQAEEVEVVSVDGSELTFKGTTPFIYLSHIHRFSKMTYHN